VLITVMALLGTLIGVVTPTAASAAGGSTIFLNSFANSTVDGVGAVTKPTASTGTNVVCLSATGNAATPPLLTCPSTTDAPGSGKLRLTGPVMGQVGGVFGATSFPSSNGLDVTFNAYQYGGGQGGEGIAFALAAVDPANPLPPTSIGSAGAGLGYSGSSTVSGWPTPTSDSVWTCSATSARPGPTAPAAPTPPRSPGSSPAQSWPAARGRGRSATAV
jgi:hypothetical protein